MSQSKYDNSRVDSVKLSNYTSFKHKEGSIYNQDVRVLHDPGDRPETT